MNTYARSVVDTIRAIPNKGKDDIIVDIGACGGFDTLYRRGDGEVLLFSTESSAVLPMLEATEELAYGVFSFLDANKNTLRQRDRLIEEEDPENMNWIGAPVTVKNGNDSIGMVGTIGEPQPSGEELRSIRFFSPDGSYAVLTIYGDKSEVEKGLAKQDLRAISRAIDEYVNKVV